MVGDSSRLYSRFAEIMDPVLGLSLHKHVHFLFQDPDSARLYFGQARLSENDEGYGAEQEFCSPLETGIREYLNRIASKRKPATIICDDEGAHLITGQNSHLPSNKHFLVACDEGLVRLYRASDWVCEELPEQRRSSAEASAYIDDSIEELVRHVGKEVRFPSSLAVLLRDDLTGQMYFGSMEVSSGDVIKYSHDISPIKGDALAVIDALFDTCAAPAVLCQQSVADIITETLGGEMSGSYRVVERGGKLLSIYAPSSPVVPRDVLQARGYLEAVVQETLLSGRVPVKFYAVALHPENATYYGSVINLTTSDEIHARIDFLPPNPHRGASANDIAAHLLSHHPGLPLMCGREEMEDICIFYPDFKDLGRHHRKIRSDRKSLDIYFPNPLIQ